MKYDNDILVENKKTSRKVIEKMYQMYSSELAGRDYIYDGEMNLFSVGPLPQTFFEFSVVLDETSVRSVSFFLYFLPSTGTIILFNFDNSIYAIWHICII